MDVYLDLSFFACMSLHAFSLVYANIILPLKGRKINYVFLLFFICLPVFSLPFFKVDNVIFYLTYDLLILFAFLPLKNKFNAMMLYMICYYILISSALFIDKGIIHYHFVLLVTKPISIITIIFIVFPYVALIIFSLIIKRAIIKYHFRYKVNLKYHDEVYAFSGYLDSGNTLVHQGLPVIFIKASVLGKINLKEEVKVVYSSVNNTNRSEACYLGLICLVKGRKKIYKKILFSVVSNEHYFNNCDSLLNAYLI